MMNFSRVEKVCQEERERLGKETSPPKGKLGEYTEDLVGKGVLVVDSRMGSDVTLALCSEQSGC